LCYPAKPQESFGALPFLNKNIFFVQIYDRWAEPDLYPSKILYLFKFSLIREIIEDIAT
jgi:hypothetical protein